MQKYSRKELAELHVTGRRPKTYKIHWPDKPPEWLPERVGAGWSMELQIGALAWLVPDDGRLKRRRPVNTRSAVAGLLALETDFLRWRVRREAMWELLWAEYDAKLLGDDAYHIPDARKPAIRAMGVQHRKYRDRFAGQLIPWVNRYGSLGIEEHGLEMVDTIMLAALQVREWVALPGADTGVRRSHATFPTPFGSAGKGINKAAGLCTRYSANSEWEAPSLWSALCFDLRRYDELGWKFGVCAARDCGNLLLQTRTDKLMCSERCGKRERDQERRQQPR